MNRPNPILLSSRLLSSELLGDGYPVTAGPELGSAGTIRFPDPGRCPHHGTVTTVAFDNSGSVTGGNDPVGNRFEEAALALTRLSKACRCGRCEAAILHFDTPTSGDVPPTPIRGRGLHAIREGLAAPLDGAGNSLLGPSLRAARALADAHPDHEHSLVVFSDFQLFDHDLNRVYDELAEFPGHVHAVVLGSAPPPGRLIDDSAITVTRISVNDAPGSVATALFDSLTTYRIRRPRTRS